MENMENFLQETAKLIADERVKEISNGVTAYGSSINYVKDVEFWKWMKQNYAGSGIFDSAETIKQYIESSPGRANWMKLQLQGKGYEWDWMMERQGQVKNLFKRYNAGVDPTQVGIDVTEKNLLSGVSKTYQHKSYTSNTKIGSQALKNTPPDTTIITQKENLQRINAGGRKVEGYQSKAQSNRARDRRFEKAAKGVANSTYTIKEVAKVSGKAGLVGAAIGCTVETIASYGKYKSGELSGKEYLTEIAKTGGNSGVTAGATAAIMIPIEAAIVSAGISIPILIPVSIVVGAAVDKIVAPMFKKGAYLENMNKMKFYDDIGEGYVDFIVCCEESARAFESYVERMMVQDNRNKYLSSIEEEVNSTLIKTYERF